MKSTHIGITLLLAPLAPLRSADPPDTNHDESKVPSYTLPEALVCFDGQAVEDAKTWREKRRPEILRAFAENVYGRTPALKAELRYEITETGAQALGGLATRQQVTIRLFPEAAAPRIDLLLPIPNAAAKPVPAFLSLNYGNQRIHDDPAIKPSRDTKTQRGEFLSALHAEPAYRLFGLRGLAVPETRAPERPEGDSIGYHLRDGPHDITRYDWQQYLHFTDRHIKTHSGTK